jgi:hypothetical protein
MRASLLLLLCTSAFGCGDVTTTPDMPAAMQDLSMAVTMDMAKASEGGALETLTVNNTLSWCTVIVTVGNGTPATFTSASMSFMAGAGTMVSLQADPRPGFFPVKWTGVSTMTGNKATYVMTGAATQAVTACCPTSAAGGGC